MRAAVLYVGFIGRDDWFVDFLTASDLSEHCLDHPRRPERTEAAPPDTGA